MTTFYPSPEYHLIEKIHQSSLAHINQQFIKTIGDDCAVRKTNGEDHLYSGDTLVENIHFSLDLMSFEELGFKAMAVNVSDIAAMGATVDSFLIQLVFPKEQEGIQEDIVALYKGVEKAVKKWQAPVVGGDLSAGPCWMIAVTVVGKSRERVLYRDGAQVGDSIWVTGYPGRSGIGLSLLLEHGRAKAEQIEKEFVSAHLSPIPRTDLGIVLAKDSSVHAMLDISDGVGKEVKTVAKESGVGVIVSLPKEIEKKLHYSKAHLPKSAKEYFLGGGEDYELLFTASREFTPPVSDVPFFKIGEVTNQKEVCLYKEESGELTPIDGGWDHF